MEQATSGANGSFEKKAQIQDASEEMLNNILGDNDLDDSKIVETTISEDDLEKLINSKSNRKQTNIEDSSELEDIIADKTTTKKKDEIKNEMPELDDIITNNGTSDMDDLGEYEPAIAEFFANKFAEELELELEETPKSISEVTDLIKNLVAENSKPVYPDEKVEKLAEFVAAGGRFEDFYDKTVVGRISLDDIDLENEAHQKSILKEHLINTMGFKESVANKKIQRWEDAGVLYDEAEEALESVKDFRQKEEQLLLENQKQYAAEQKARQQKFITDVESSIKALNAIAGYDISDKEKKDLRSYILNVDNDGYTPYQKDYQKSVQHLIESAYFIKNRDKFVKKIEKTAETNAAKKLKQTLSSGKGVRGVVENTDNDIHATLASLGSQFLPRK